MITTGLTRNQALVFDALMRAGQPMSAYSLLDRLRDNGFRAPLQVYRALEKLTERGLVHRLESLNAFVACSHPDCADHAMAAFAICETCGRVEEFTDRDVARLLATWADRAHFLAKKTTIELRGLCGQCVDWRPRQDSNL